MSSSDGDEGLPGPKKKRATRKADRSEVNAHTIFKKKCHLFCFFCHYNTLQSEVFET